MVSCIVNARIDGKLKTDVDAILSGIGLSGPEAIRLLYTQIRNTRTIPFALTAPEEPKAELKSAIKRAQDYVSGTVQKGFKKYASVTEAMGALAQDPK